MIKTYRWPSWLLCSSLVGLWIFGPSAGARAQRGEINPAKPSALASPSQGFPGFFDTNVAAKGSLVVEWPPVILPLIPMPSIAVDYGVSETLTVGTNALVSTLPWLFGARGISLKVRTLIAGDESMQSAATFYGAYIGSKALNVSWQMVTSNNSWKLAPRHIVSGQAMLLNFGIATGSESDLDYTNIRLTNVGLGAGYQFIFSDTVAISAHTLAPVYTNLEADSVAANLNMNLDARSGQILWALGRASLDIRRDDWIYSMGGLYMHGLQPGVKPWFSAATRW
jgi:hypothetical protein